MQDEIDPFALSFPLWAVLDTDIFADDEKNFFSAIAKGEAYYGQGDIPFVVVFTDQDLAERFVDQPGAPPHRYVPIDNAESFAGFLKDAQDHGFAIVGFDPGPNKDPVVIPIGNILAAYRAWIDERRHAPHPRG